MFNSKFFAKIYKSFELEWQRMVFNVATFKCKIIAKKQAKRQKNTKFVQNKAKGAKIFWTVFIAYVHFLLMKKIPSGISDNVSIFIVA